MPRCRNLAALLATVHLLASVASAQVISASPTSGTLGTPVTVTISPQSLSSVFNSNTSAIWTGVYQPIMGAAVGPFTVTFAPNEVTIVDDWTAVLLIGNGTFVDAPDPGDLDGGGTLQGTLTFITPDGCPLDQNGDEEIGSHELALLLGNWGAGACPTPCIWDFDEDGEVGSSDLAILLGLWGECANVQELSTSQSFAPATEAAAWHFVDYVDGLNGIVPPSLGGKADDLPMYLLSATPSPMSPTEQQFAITLGNHIAAVLKIEENAESLSDAPSTINADLVSLNPQGLELARRTVQLVRDSNDGDPSWITYRNDLSKPIILIDTAIDTSSFPNFVLLFGQKEGTALVIPVQESNQ